MVDFDLEKLKELSARDLNTDQLSTLEQIRSLGKRQQRGIGTGGLTLGELEAAGEVAEAGPDLMEAGYGPQEYNPQRRYETRFSQRAGIGDGPTPFEGLESNIALGQTMDDRAPTGPVGGMMSGEGNGTSEGGYDRTADMDTLGHFGMDAFTGSLEDMGINAATNFGLASFLGLSPEIAAKLTAMGIFNPATMLGFMGNVGYGAAKDMGVDQMARESMVGDIMDDVSGPAPEMGPTTEAALGPQASAAQQLGVGWGGQYGLGQYGSEKSDAIAKMENMSPFEQAMAALQGVLAGPEGGWMSSTNIDPVTGLHKGQLGNDSMGVSKAMGLQSSFGDPFGTGIGNSGMGGIGGMGPGSGNGGSGGRGSNDGSGAGGATGGDKDGGRY